MYQRYTSEMMTMGTHSEVRLLVDTTTGSEYRCQDLGDATMTIETTKHPYRHLAGASFLTLVDSIMAAVNDEKWERVFGVRLVLPGGCELNVDAVELERALEDIEHCGDDLEEATELRPDLITGYTATDRSDGELDLLLPLVVNDADLPPIRLLVPLSVIGKQMQLTEKGKGPHARKADAGDSRATICHHTSDELKTTNCRGCLRRTWMIEAQKIGLSYE